MSSLSFAASILVSTLLVSVVVLVSCEKSENGCDKLERHLLKHLPNDLEATKNYDAALRISALSFAKSKVVKNWKLVHEAVETKSCSEISIKAWLSFGKCLYNQERLSAVLKPDLIQFSDVCQKEILIFLPQEQHKYEIQVYSSVRKPLLQFLSDSFIARYFEENPEESTVHLGKSETDQECCTPDKAAIPLAITSLLEVVEHKEAVDRKKAVEKLRSKAKVIELLDEYLYFPCETYHQVMYHHLYRDLIQTSKKFGPNLLRMVIDNDRSNDFKLGVFRYQFCSRLQNMDSRKKFTYAVINKLQSI